MIEMMRVIYTNLKFILIISALWLTAIGLTFKQYQHLDKLKNEIHMNKTTIAKLNIAYQSLINKRKNFSAVNHAYKEMEEQSANMDMQKILFSENIFQLNQRLKLNKLAWQYDAVIQYLLANLAANHFYQVFSLPVKLRMHVNEEQQWLNLINQLYLQGRYYQVNNCEISAHREQRSSSISAVDHLEVFCLLNLAYPQANNILDKHHMQQARSASQIASTQSGRLP